MKANKLLSQVLFALGIITLAASTAIAAESGTTTITVTATSKKEAPPSLVISDVQLSQGKERKQVAKWVKAEKLYLAILIDDSIESETASQWNDLKQFMLSQPPTTSIAVGYAQDASVRVAQDFTTDHELAAK